MTDDQAPTGALTEWAIAQVEAHPVRNAETRAVTGYMLSADKWREIRAALRKAEAALAEAEQKGAREALLAAAAAWPGSDWWGEIDDWLRVRATHSSADRTGT